MTRAGLPRPTTARVLAVYRSASDQDVADGRSWYRRAHDAACELDPIDPARGAAVIAVLSPSTPWLRNVELARQTYAMRDQGADVDTITSDLPTLKANARKAAMIVWGADPAAVVSGPKVTPFWQRIAEAATRATGPGSVVVDRHAHDAAVGRWTTDAERGAFLARKGGHLAVAMCYVRAAATLNRSGEAATMPDGSPAAPITPAEVQAVVWLAWRRDHGHHQARAVTRAEDAARTVASVTA